ncbi:indoleamine 2,3-dioxygenase [Kibdelosporangium aridum]|uniref:indoleamine 2,3-dioxygenase n=1 Tax=Kibdelosporangium aridum TaxID=2030 RepID=UPI00068DCA63
MVLPERPGRVVSDTMAGQPLVSGLTDYSVDKELGFLPAADPVPALDERFAPWERLARDISPLIMTGRLRAAVEAMPELSPDGLGGPELERAYLLLCCLGNAYIWAEPEPQQRVPAVLAVPWCHVAALLDRPPVITHSSIVLNNWRRLTPDEPLSTTNIDTQMTFLGGVDEKWFYLGTVGVELAGAPALPLLVDAQHAVAADDTDRLAVDLLAIEPVIRATTRAILDIERWCDPYVFYHRVRRYLTGWSQPGVIYEGVHDEPLVFAGGNAAQSSLIQAFDAGLGIRHEHKLTGTFLRGMRAYMPLAHRRFVKDLEAGPSVYDFVARRLDHPQLTESYTACVRAMRELRSQHLGLTGKYIGRFRRRDHTEKGTGGTDFVPILAKSREETRARELG